MNSNDLSGLHDTSLSDGLDDRLQILAALGDVLGSLKFDELSDDTLPCLGQLIYRTAAEANELAEEMWHRLRAAGDSPEPAPWAGHENATGAANTDGAKAEADSGYIVGQPRDEG